MTYKEQQLALRRALKKAPGMEQGASLATLEKGGEYGEGDKFYFTVISLRHTHRMLD